jgi:uncharacterized membrane protein
MKSLQLTVSFFRRRQTVGKRRVGVPAGRFGLATFVVVGGGLAIFIVLVVVWVVVVVVVVFDFFVPFQIVKS